jgi:hypothetical protein
MFNTVEQQRQRHKEVVEACEELERALGDSDESALVARSCLVDVLQGIGKEVERCGDGSVVSVVSGWGGCFFKTMHVLCFTPRYGLFVCLFVCLFFFSSLLSLSLYIYVCMQNCASI